MTTEVFIIITIVLPLKWSDLRVYNLYRFVFYNEDIKGISKTAQISPDLGKENYF